MRFYLGTHQPYWLWRTEVPLFVSARALRRRKSMHRATCDWALDSGGFTELSMHGAWQTTPEQYVEDTRRWSDSIGRMQWAAIQDWMCEPFMIEKTGLSIAEHQKRTVDSWHTLNRLAPEIPWAPVVQGWKLDDYLAHADAYRASGVDLAALPIVGVGSVCRRQAMGEAEQIVRAIAAQGIRVHGFGFKLQGLRRCADAMASSDSLAWSFAARRDDPLPGCSHRNCANCMIYAMQWREKVMRIVDGPRQLVLF